MPRLPAKPEYELPDLTNRPPKERVSYSELATFRDCPLKWQLRYGYRLQPPERQVRLDRGSCWHKMLEAHYDGIRKGADKETVHAMVMLALNDYAESIGGIADEEFVTLTAMYAGHVRIYGSDARYEVVDIEQAFEFPFPVDGAPELVIVGRIDLETIDRETGDFDVWDHKSASKRDVSKDGFLSEMLLEDQFLLYAGAKRRAGTPCKHVIYNVARTDRLKRKMLDTELYNRVRIPYSDEALDEVWEDHRRAATALVGMWNNPDLTYSVPNPRQCGWKCEFQRSHVDARAKGRNPAAVAIDYGFTFKPPSGDKGAEIAAENAEAEVEATW